MYNRNPILLLFLLIFSIPDATAKVWRVNNNSSISADFTSLQAAHDGAAAGDTLHLEGSPTDYGDLACNKKLIILGPGYFLTENANTQAVAISAKVSHIDLDAEAAGTVLMGLELILWSTVEIYANDITIRRCKAASGGIYIQYLSNSYPTPVTNILIAENYGISIGVHSPSTNVVIQNNFITNEGNALYLHADAVAVVQNNIFHNGEVIAYNSFFMNNIMIAGSLEGTGNTMLNNLSNGAQFGTANGNQANISMNAVFIGPGNGISTDGQWQLKPGSPAIGAGYGSTPQSPIDAGIYGGQEPYVLSGLPPVPAIYYLQHSPTGHHHEPMNITIKLKSHH